MQSRYNPGIQLVKTPVPPYSPAIRSGFWFAAMVVTNPPEEVRHALASSHDTIALLLLLLLHFVVTHILGLACVVLGSATIVGLDRRLRSHADAQVRPSLWKPLGTSGCACIQEYSADTCNVRPHRALGCCQSCVLQPCFVRASCSAYY